MPSESYYNSLYSQSEKADTFGKGEAAQSVKDILKYKNSGSVLEVGAGDGRNSLFLSKNGFAVTARDISEVGVKKIQNLAQIESLAIVAENKNALEFNKDESFDVIISTFMFQHLTDNEARTVIKLMKEHTINDGLNVIVAYTRDSAPKPNDHRDINFYPNKGELKELYADWEILEYTEDSSVAFVRPDKTNVINVHAKLIARKPQ